MAVPRRRHSKARRDRARTHKKLHARSMVRCDTPDCDGIRPPHRMCPKCGSYNGRSYKVVVKS